MTLRHRNYLSEETLSEMAALPSLKQLQQKGNNKPATKDELRNARKRALKLKSAPEASQAAQDAHDLMQKREIIQVFFDRAAELSGSNTTVPKPIFLAGKNTKWESLNDAEILSVVNWIAKTKTDAQVEAMIANAKAQVDVNKTPRNVARLKLYKQGYEAWKKNRKEWRDKANKR